MKTIFISVSLIIFFFSGLIFAASDGSSALHFLKIGVGSRSIGMAGTGSSFIQDPSSGYLNPANLAALNRKQFYFAHSEWLENIKYENLYYALPIKKGTLSLGINYLHTDKIQETLAGGIVTGNTIDSNDMLIQLSYAKKISQSFCAGGNIKYIKESLADVSGKAIAIDVGCCLKLNDNIKLAFTGKNLGSKIKFDKESFPLPFLLSGEISYNYINKLIIALAGEKYNDDDIAIKLGLDYAISFLSFRIGIEPGKDIGQGLTAGIGIRFNTITIDYAIADYGDLGLIHNFGINIRSKKSY